MPCKGHATGCNCMHYMQYSVMTCVITCFLHPLHSNSHAALIHYILPWCLIICSITCWHVYYMLQCCISPCITSFVTSLGIWYGNPLHDLSPKLPEQCQLGLPAFRASAALLCCRLGLCRSGWLVLNPRVLGSWRYWSHDMWSCRVSWNSRLITRFARMSRWIWCDLRIGQGRSAAFLWGLVRPHEIRGASNRHRAWRGSFLDAGLVSSLPHVEDSGWWPDWQPPTRIPGPLPPAGGQRLWHQQTQLLVFFVIFE